MAGGRVELDIQKSSGQSYRSLPTIAEESAKAQQMLSEKSKDEMTSHELKNLGITFNEKSDYIKAQEFLNAALEKVEKETLSENEKNFIIASCHYGLAICKRELGRPHAAIALFIKASKQVEKISEEIKGLHDLRYVIARNIGISYLVIEDYANAISNFSAAVHIAEKTGQTGRIPAVKSYLGLSTVLAGKLTEGLKLLEEARLLYPKNVREESMDWAAHRYHMGRALENTNKPMDALVEYAESRRLRMQIDCNEIGLVYYHSRLSDSNIGCARVYLSLGRNLEAAASLAAVLASCKILAASGKTITSLASQLTLLNLQLTSLSSTQTSSNLFYQEQQTSSSVTSTYKAPGLRRESMD